jgi:hypothetical protein
VRQLSYSVSVQWGWWHRRHGDRRRTIHGPSLIEAQATGISDRPQLRGPPTGLRCSSPSPSSLTWQYMILTTTTSRRVDPVSGYTGSTRDRTHGDPLHQHRLLCKEATGRWRRWVRPAILMSARMPRRVCAISISQFFGLIRRTDGGPHVIWHGCNVRPARGVRGEIIGPDGAGRPLTSSSFLDLDHQELVGREL